MDKKEKNTQETAVIIILIALLMLITFNTPGIRSRNIDVKIKYSGSSAGNVTGSADAAVTTPAVTTPAEINTETEKPADTSQKPENETPEKSDSMSLEEIVALYNTSVNKVKGSASKITRNYNHVSIPEETLELPSAIQGIGKTAIGTFVKPDDNVQEWTTADDFKLGFPVGGEDYSSHMTADMVESATCKDNGSAYEVEIILKDDAITSPAKGEGYAGVFNTTSASTFEDISIPAVTFNEVKINGIDGSIKCTIDKASERVTVITFSNTDVMYLNVKVAFSTLEAKMNMVQESDFIIEY